MTELTKKTLEYSVDTATAKVKAKLSIDEYSQIRAIQMKVDGEGSLTPEDLSFTVEECVKEARNQGYLPKSSQGKLS